QAVVLGVLVIREPVGEALLLDTAPEMGLPVVAEIVFREPQVRRLAREDPDLVSADRGVRNRDVVPALDGDSSPRELLRISPWVGSVDRDAREIDRDVVEAEEHTPELA